MLIVAVSPATAAVVNVRIIDLPSRPTAAITGCAPVVTDTRLLKFSPFAANEPESIESSKLTVRVLVPDITADTTTGAVSSIVTEL